MINPATVAESSPARKKIQNPVTLFVKLAYKTKNLIFLVSIGTANFYKKIKKNKGNSAFLFHGFLNGFCKRFP